MKQERMLFLIVAGIGATAMVYQFSVISALTFMLGDSLILFSVFSGTFLFSMGVGATLATPGAKAEIHFVGAQIGLALVGFLVLPFLFLIYAYLYNSINSSPSISSTIFVPILWGAGLAAELIFGVLIGMQLPLVQSITARRWNADLNLSKMLAVDYLGSFIGAVAFPLLLFPLFGIFKTIFIAAAVNAMLSLLAAQVLGLKDLKYLISSVCLMFVILIAFVKAPLLEKEIDKIVYEKTE